MPLPLLPTDLWVQIAVHLPLPDLACFGSTCRGAVAVVAAANPDLDRLRAYIRVFGLALSELSEAVREASQGWAGRPQPFGPVLERLGDLLQAGGRWSAVLPGAHAGRGTQVILRTHGYGESHQYFVCRSDFQLPFAHSYQLHAAVTYTPSFLNWVQISPFPPAPNTNPSWWAYTHFVNPDMPIGRPPQLPPIRNILANPFITRPDFVFATLRIACSQAGLRMDTRSCGAARPMQGQANVNV